MIFFVKFIYAIFPSAFIFGLLKSFYERKTKYNSLFLIGFLSFLLGAIIQTFFMQALYDSEFVSVIGAVLCICFALFVFTYLLYTMRFFLNVFASLLFAYSGAVLIYFVYDLPITSTEVINSSLIIHMSYIFLALALCYFIVFAINTLSKSYTKTIFFHFALIISILTYGIIIVGNIFAYLIKNDIITVTSTRISFVAKVTYYSFLDIYLFTFLGLIFIYLYFKDRISMKPASNIKNSQLRKFKKQRLVQNRWIYSTIIALLILCPTLAYYDLVASRPPSLSHATVVTPNENKNIVLDIEPLKDGDLHRFAYITDDGREVRFFAINRYKDKEKVVAVFDACMICGDMGYIKKDNQVICLSCGVRIFIPSIGQPGGCNPIPLNFTKKDGKLIIAQDVLDAGAAYFTKVVKKEVTDIISGATLYNTEAKYSYEYLGKTFFFENEENLEKFRNAPEDYAQNVTKRRWRVEGHEGK